MLPENFKNLNLYRIYNDIQDDLSAWNIKYNEILSSLTDDEEKAAEFTDSYNTISRNISDKNNEYIQWTTAIDTAGDIAKDEYYSRYGN